MEMDPVVRTCVALAAYLPRGASLPAFWAARDRH